MLPNIEQVTLDNGVPVYLINEGEQEVMKMEFVFKAGKWYEEKNLVADLANRMMREGTVTRNAKQIADTFDFYGANFNTDTGFETAGVSLYTLTKHVDQLFPVLQDIFNESIFPEEELKTILNNRKQRLSVDLKKNDFLANRNFVRALFGSKYPYGRITEFENFEDITVTDLKSFFKKYYRPSNLFIIISGRFDGSLIKSINHLFGNKQEEMPISAEATMHSIESSSELVQHDDKPDAVQSAVALGNITINKTHPDFLKLSILNTVFGGYFGSRLMSNIREEKGYTYGIHSSLISYPHAAFIEIFSEVGKDVRESTLNEVKKEINLLRSEPINSEELSVVKNYISGRILRSIDGPIKFSETLKTLLIYKQDTSYIHKWLKTVREVTAEELLELANTYFDYDKMYKITVG
jgi:predicted Zn-dependent peptidase